MYEKNGVCGVPAVRVMTCRLSMTSRGVIFNIFLQYLREITFFDKETSEQQWQCY